MSDEQTEAYDRFAERYAAGDVPWDHEEPPPEVIAFAEELTPGRALDLGCGYGRAAIYLAGLSWHVDGVDVVDLAVDEARARARRAGVTDRTRFLVGSVTDLEALDLTPPYDLAVDVGCLHRMDEPKLISCRDGLLPRLREGAWFLLFAHLHDPSAPPDDDHKWVDEAVIRSVFDRGFELERVEYGTTQVGDKPRWRSAWFWYRRMAD